MASSTSTMVDIDKKACKLFQNPHIKPHWSKPFPVIGKGTLLFNIDRSEPFYIIVRGNQSTIIDPESWIGLAVDTNRVSFLDKIHNGHPKTLCEKTSSELFGSNIGIEPNFMCTYWLSYDRDRMVIKYGKGYRMKKTTILEYDFECLDSADEKKLIRKAFFDPKVDRCVELYYDQPWETLDVEYTAEVVMGLAEVQKEVDFDPQPLVSDLSCIVKDSSTVNLYDLDSGKYIYSASLPLECRILYDNITAENVNLDYQATDSKNQGFKLSDAIRYSIETQGCALNKKLQSKDNEFGPSDPTQTYLRITLGKDHGNSPGIPYVLELWPKNHGSPIHNHGNAYATIRVLHGGLTITYYNKVSESTKDDCDSKEKRTDTPTDTQQFLEKPGAQKLGQFAVKKGDITWISPNWYQTHMLWNDTNDYCATIQCYQYGNNDYMNWPFFDYIKSTDIIDEFTPNSDYTFTEMVKLVMEEYKARPQTN